MRTNHDALAALDTQVGLPDRNFPRDIALLPLRGRRRISSICWECAYRQQVTSAGNHLTGHLTNKFRRAIRNRLRELPVTVSHVGNCELVKMRQCRIDRGVVLFEDRVAALP